MFNYGLVTARLMVSVVLPKRKWFGFALNSSRELRKTVKRKNRERRL